MGRKCKLTPELQQKIVELIAAGNHYEVVCKAVGIGTTTFYRWLERGREEAAERETVAGQPPTWITTTEAVDLVGVQANKLRQAARHGEIRAEKRGNLWFLDQGDVLMWRNPAGSEFLRFYEAVEHAAAQAEVDFVELWKRQAPGSWRSVRDFLARRYPERWGPRHQLETKVQASIETDVKATVEGKVSHKIDPEDAKEIIELLKQNLRQQSIDFGREQENIRDALIDLGSVTAEKLGEVTGYSEDKLVRHLKALIGYGEVKRETGADRETLFSLTWTPRDDEQAEEPPIEEPPLAPVVPPEDTCLKAPILRGKYRMARVRDEEEPYFPLM